MKKPLFALALLATASAHAVVLHDNGEVTNGLGLSVVAPGNNTFGFASSTAGILAEDFTVATGKRWAVSAMNLFAYQSGATKFTFSRVKWTVVKGDVNAGPMVASGDSAVGDAGLMGYRVSDSDLGSTARGIYRMQVDLPAFSLEAGTYWLTWQLLGDDSLPGPFVAPTSDGASGNAMRMNLTLAMPSFVAAVDSGSLQPVNLPFLLQGTEEDVVSPPAVPEPSTYALMLLGVAGVLSYSRSRFTPGKVQA